MTQNHNRSNTNVLTGNISAETAGIFQAEYRQGYELGNRGIVFDSRQVQEIVLFSKVFRQTLMPNHPPVQCTPGDFSSTIVEQRRETDYRLIPSGTEV
jgi:hypothetical protein